MKTINPSTGEPIAEYRDHQPQEVPAIIESVNNAWLTWKSTTFDDRAILMKNAAAILRKNREEYARLMTL